MEDVAEAAPDSLRFFQVYFSRNKETNKDIFKRAEDAGYKALVITADTSVLGKRESDIRNKFSLPPGLDIVNVKRYLETSSFKGQQGSGLEEYVKSYKHNGFTWTDIAEVKSMTKLPIILKGIQ